MHPARQRAKRENRVHHNYKQLSKYGVTPNPAAWSKACAKTFDFRETRESASSVESFEHIFIGEIPQTVFTTNFEGPEIFESSEGTKSPVMSEPEILPGQEEEINQILQDQEVDLDDAIAQELQAEKDQMALEVRRTKAAELLRLRKLRVTREEAAKDKSRQPPSTKVVRPEQSTAAQAVNAKVAALITNHTQEASEDNATSASGSDTSSDDRDSCASQSRRKKQRGKIHRASGLHDTNKTFVRQKQKFPHAALQPEFLGRTTAPTFEDLNFSLFVAGELEIILNGKCSTTEVMARLQLLKNYAYKSDYTDFATLRDVHCAILRKIENGFATWSSDFAPVENQVLASRAARREKKSRFDKTFDKAFDKGDKSDKKGEKKYYCRFFQQR